jgi:secreted trypsin-like serine protease
MFRQVFVIAALVAVCLASPVPDEERGGRIVGGFNAGTTQFPYQVSLRTAANFHFCGGSIINNRWALSAAHCTIGRAQNAVRVVVGTVFLNSGGVSHVSSRIVNHPSYNAQTIANDVSVVQTATTIGFNAQVQPIALGSAFVGGGVAAVVSGWGGTAVTGGAAPNHLQGLNTRTLTNADCRARHSTGNAAFVFDHKICTFTQSGQGICQGDSGGPLAAGGAVIGTVSWNIPCARGFPDAFDRTASFRSWILSVI